VKSLVEVIVLFNPSNSFFRTVAVMRRKGVLPERRVMQER